MRTRARHQYTSLGTASYIPADIQAYLDGYPGKPDNLARNKNLEFYLGKIPSKPSGDYIDNIHKTWFGNYDLLEEHHGYVQWLFPIQEHGLNIHAQELYVHERDTMIKSKACMERCLRSYELMLDFYGFQLVDKRTGEVSRNKKNFRERFDNLVSHSHNFLRITRILKWLGEFGLEHYKEPWLMCFVTEVYEHGTLSRCEESMNTYWIPTLKDPVARSRLQSIVAQKQMVDEDNDDVEFARADTILERDGGDDATDDENTPKRQKRLLNVVGGKKKEQTPPTIKTAPPPPSPQQQTLPAVLPKLLVGVCVYLHPSIPEDRRKQFQRWVVAYGGSISGSPTASSLTHFLVDTDVVAGAKDRKLVMASAPARGCYVLDADWLLLTHKKRQKMQEAPFLL